MKFNQEQNAYQLQLPEQLIVFTDSNIYGVTASSKPSTADDVYEFITSYEDYVFVLKDYIKNSEDQIKNHISVLLLYYDEKEKLHAALSVAVSIALQVTDKKCADISHYDNRKVKTFQKWQI